MPTSYTDQAYPVDIFNVSIGDPMTVVSITLVDIDDDGLIETGETINGFTITNVYVGDTITVDGVLIEGVTFTTSGGSFFTPNDGSVLVPGTTDATSTVAASTSMPVSTLGPPCFVAGTLVLTPMGHVRVEDLRKGDWVYTRDNGPQRLSWCGQVRVNGVDQFAPVRFDVGAIGNTEVLEVSQQHRVLICSSLAELYLGESEVWVSAKHLTYRDGITIQPRRDVTYVHIMFERHEAVYANGCWSESFFYGDQNVYGLGEVSKRELEQLFALSPELLGGFDSTSRYCAKLNEALMI